MFHLIKNLKRANKNEIINLKHNFAHSLQLVKLKPKEIKIIALHIPNKFSKWKNILFSHTNTKLSITLDSSIHSPDQNNCIFIVVENISNSKTSIRKNTKLGIVGEIAEEEISQYNHDEQIFRLMS